jgi:hypothetical protein
LLSGHPISRKEACFFDETNEEQFCEKHELQFGFCPLFPESEKVEFLASLKKEGFYNFRRV